MIGVGGDEQRQDAWARIQASAEVYAMEMSDLCTEPFSELILHELHEFCSQAPPKSAEELEARQRQRNQLTAKTGAISFASTMATLHRGAAPQLAELTKQFCVAVCLDDDVTAQSGTLSAQITSVCHADSRRTFEGR
jgi:hypothetical protein